MRPVLRSALGFLSALCAVQAVFAAQPAHIQIKCEPGVQILLDGTSRGVTNTEVGGLIVQDIPVGRHLLRIIKPGFIPQDVEVTLRAGQVLVHEVKSFVPRVRVRQEGKEGESTVQAEVGTLVIQSLPVECVIDIPSAGLNGRRKSKDKIALDDVPAGTHSARFTAMGKQIEHAIALPVGGAVRVLVNFLDGKVTESRGSFLGMSFEPIHPLACRLLNLDHGLHVAYVTPRGPADKAGIREGDYVLEFNNRRAGDPGTFRAMVFDIDAGSTVPVRVLRGQEKLELRARLGERSTQAMSVPPSRVHYQVLGLTIADLTEELAREFGLTFRKAVVVTQVDPGFLAATAENGPLRQGELIEGLKRRRVASVEEFQKVFRQLPAEKKGPDDPFHFFFGKGDSDTTPPMATSAMTLLVRGRDGETRVVTIKPPAAK